MTLTASAKLFLEKASFWYKFSKCVKAARSVEITCRATLIADASAETGPAMGSGGVIGNVGIGSVTKGGHNGIEGVRGVGRGAWRGAMSEAMMAECI